jgi:hypothetical protein
MTSDAKSAFLIGAVKNTIQIKANPRNVTWNLRVQRFDRALDIHQLAYVQLYLSVSRLISKSKCYSDLIPKCLMAR